MGSSTLPAFPHRGRSHATDPTRERPPVRADLRFVVRALFLQPPRGEIGERTRSQSRLHILSPLVADIPPSRCPKYTIHRVVRPLGWMRISVWLGGQW